MGGRRRRTHAGGLGRVQGRRSHGRGRRRDAATLPCPRRGAAILAEGARELHRKQWITNKQQSKVDVGWLSMWGSQFCAPTTPPPQKRHIYRWDLGEGVAGFNLAQKGRAGDKINMRWTMTMTMIARGGSKGKVLMIVFQSISAY